MDAGAEIVGVAPAKTTATTVHSQFGPGDGTDLVIQSSDGVLFHVNRNNLDRCAEAFPGSDAQISRLNWRIHPVLDNLEFKKLLAVAEAAEKYHFYSAAPICQMALRHNIPKYPLEIFRHVLKHDYPEDFIDEVALVLRPVPVSSASDPRVHPSVAPAWLVYQGEWNDIFKRACKQNGIRALEFFDPQVPIDEQLEPVGRGPAEVNVPCLHPCKQCFFTISWWCMSQLSAEAWPSKATDSLFNTPLPPCVSSALERCPCPPPWEREISMQTGFEASLIDKEVQNLAVIDFIKMECLADVHNMDRLSVLMKRLSRS